MLLEMVLSAVLQLALFSAIPFFYWLIRHKNRQPFLQWVGLKKAAFPNKSKAMIFSCLAFLILISSGLLLVSALDNQETMANAKFASMGVSGLGLILIYAIVQTGLSEELLFRGFLLKRLSGRWGFGVGNAIQALLFGLLHGVVLFNTIPAILVIAIIAFSATAGGIMGYINEKLGNGSILPSWFIHSLMNISSSLVVAFNVIG